MASHYLQITTVCDNSNITGTGGLPNGLLVVGGNYDFESPTGSAGILTGRNNVGLPGGISSITRVKGRTYAMRGSSHTRTIEFYIYDGTAAYQSAIALGTTYAYQDWTNIPKPSGGSWDVADFLLTCGFKFGFRISTNTSATQPARVDYLHLEVVYSAGVRGGLQEAISLLIGLIGARFYEHISGILMFERRHRRVIYAPEEVPQLIRELKDYRFPHTVEMGYGKLRQTSGISRKTSRSEQSTCGGCVHCKKHCA